MTDDPGGYAAAAGAAAGAAGSAASLAVSLSDFRRFTEVAMKGIEGELKLLNRSTDQNDKRLEQFDKRISALERRIWMISGAAILASAGASAGIAQLFGGA